MRRLRAVKRALLLVAVLIGMVVVACGGSDEPEGDPRISKHAVVGEDDRVRITDTTAFPWRAIAYLELYDDSTGEVGQCTGTFIGPDAVLTAAHCLWDSERGWVDRVRVVPGKNGRDEPFGSEWASGLWVPDAWIDEGEPPLRDWGVVSLPDGRLGQRTGWLTLAGLSDDTLTTGDFEPAIVGYHGDVSPPRSLWGHFAEAFVAVQDSNLLYDIDATPGSSGSAILFSDAQGGVWIVGVHAYGIDLGESEGYNFGRRVTGSVLMDIWDGCETLSCETSWEIEGLAWPPGESSTTTTTPVPTATPESPAATQVPSVNISSCWWTTSRVYNLHRMHIFGEVMNDTGAVIGVPQVRFRVKDASGATIHFGTARFDSATYVYGIAVGAFASFEERIDSYATDVDRASSVEVIAVDGQWQGSRRQFAPPLPRICTRRN
jgi:glutamyl endopeptidase